jgi:hypothetical protein
MVSIALSAQKRGEKFSESWRVACLVGEVVLLGLWKVFTNLLLAGLNLFHQPVVSRINRALCRHHCR